MEQPDDINKIEINHKLLDFIDRVNTIDAIPADATPKRGVYFLFNHGECVYIGKTDKGIPRIFQHADKEFDSYKFIELSEFTREEVGQLEMVLMALIPTKHNGYSLTRGLAIMMKIIDKL